MAPHPTQRRTGSLMRLEVLWLDSVFSLARMAHAEEEHEELELEDTEAAQVQCMHLQRLSAYPRVHSSV